MTLKLLVVDDDAAIGAFLDTVLTADGYAVTVLSDPTLAEKTVREGGFHLVLLDVMMPVQDGITTLEQIHRADRNLGVVMMTGFPSVDTAVEAMKRDALDYLRKPFTVDELRAVVTASLKKKGYLRSPEDELHKSLGETLRTLRQERGLTLKALATKTGLSVSLISQIERAETSASLSSLYRLAAALEVRLSTLFGEY